MNETSLRIRDIKRYNDIKMKLEKEKKAIMKQNNSIGAIASEQGASQQVSSKDFLAEKGLRSPKTVSSSSG